MIMALLHRYDVWLTLSALAVLVCERAAPWRKQQPLLRPQWGQDVAWFVLNGYLLSFVLRPLTSTIGAGLDGAFDLMSGASVGSIRVLAGLPLWQQIVVLLVVADFMEWCVHSLLHRIPWLWKIHRVHHSIKTMDWIGNFRFNWMEPVVYKTVKYIPLTLLGVRWEAMLVVAVSSTMIGFLNHSNMRISWGPLRYVINSPCMHIWHHEKRVRGRAGVNFGIVFSMWDWAFGTAFMPGGDSQPEELGFAGEERVSTSLAMRLVAPFWDSRPAE